MFAKFAMALLCTLSLSAPARADFIDLWANKVDMPLNKAPHTGKSRLLLIPVQIDYTGANGSYPAIDMNELQGFFTAPASRTQLNFKGFIDIESNGKFQPEVTVAPLVRYDGCPTMLAGANCTISRGDVTALKHGMDFVRDVFRRTHDENKVDFSQFDVNGLGGEPDGVADGVMLVVNVPNVGIGFPIEYVNSGSNLNGGNGGPLILDGVKIPYVAVGGSSMSAGKVRFELVVLHEFGHVLGLADLYYEHPFAADPYPRWEGLHFSLMGDYPYDERASLPDPESRRALGWQELRVASGIQTMTLQPAAAGGFAVKLGMMSGGRKEYFLAEARGPVGPYDLTMDASGKPVWGLSVTHVDWSRGPRPEQGAWTERLISCLDCNPFHPFIRNLESQNLWGLVLAGPMRLGGKTGTSDEHVLFTSGGVAPIPGAGVLSMNNRYTATNWYDGSDSGIRIDNVTLNADHSVTATFTAPYVADACADVTCAPLEQCVTVGERAGNCDPLVAPQPFFDGGTPDAGGTTTTPPTVSPKLHAGCSTGGTGAAALVVGLCFSLLALRRRRAIS